MTQSKFFRRQLNHCRFTVLNRIHENRYSKKAWILYLTLICFCSSLVIIHHYSQFSEQQPITIPSPYGDFLSLLHEYNISVTILDPNILQTSQPQEKLISFGIFESDVPRLGEQKLTESLYMNQWTCTIANSFDTRFLSKSREHSQSLFTVAHVFCVYQEEFVAHLAVLLHRNEYWMVLDFDKNSLGRKFFYLKNLNFSIPLPMAIEPFSCHRVVQTNLFNVCIPENISQYLWELKYAKFVECKYKSTVWSFYDSFDSQPMDTQYHSATVKALTKIFKRQRVPAMIFLETLLGWYRQCDFIVHSLNLDFAVRGADFNEHLFGEMWKNKDFLINERFGRVETGFFKLGMFSKFGIMIDVFFMYDEQWNQKRLSIYSINNRTRLRADFDYFDDICSADFMGALVYAPCDARKLIVNEYGEDGWFVPNVNPKHANIYKLQVYDEEMFREMYHVYGKRDCQHPNINRGCD